MKQSSCRIKEVLTRFEEDGIQYLNAVFDEPEKVPGAPETEPDMVDDSRPPENRINDLRMYRTYADFLLEGELLQ